MNESNPVSPELERIARERAIEALGQQNPRFKLYRSQDASFREDDVKFWTKVILSALALQVEKEKKCICSDGFGMNLSCPIHSANAQNVRPTEETREDSGDGRFFRKKPVVIEAMRNDVGTAATIREWMDANGFKSPKWDGAQWRIQTLEGEMVADRGDWIIKGVKGEFYPCKPDIFDASYESVPPLQPTSSMQPTEGSEL